jgi:membrane protease YdiL (CAAX protease family)
MKLPTPATQIGVAVYALAYAAALIVLARDPGFSVAEPLFALAVLGGAFPALALLLTRGMEAPRIAIAHPRREALAAVAYLTIYAIVVLGFGFSWIKAAVDAPRAQALALAAAKLATMVLAPLLVARTFGHAADTEFRARLRGRRTWTALAVVGAAMLAFQCVFGRGLRTLSELAPDPTTLAWAVPLCFVWLVVEVGIVEEYLFRVFLQTRLAAWLRSEPAAIFIGALIFGLSHAPGLYLRGASAMEGVATPTIAWAIAYSVAITSTAGFVFGVLWWRTRSFGLIVLLHALTDLIPQLTPFIKTFM